MDRPDVFEALMRIKEGLDTPQNENAVIIARHDLLELTRYITDLESVITQVQNLGIVYDVSDGSGTYIEVLKPWQMLEEQLKERERT